MTLTIQIYSSGTTPIYDSSGELLDGEGLWYEDGYATGSLGGGMFVPRDPSRWWEVKGTLRVVIRDGQTIVYEGVIPSIEDRLSSSGLGQQINFIGSFGWYLMGRHIWKRWADDRVDMQTWEWDATANGADKCTLKRDKRLYFLPKSEEWADDDTAIVVYTMPEGDTIKRITFDYDLTGVAGEDWTFVLYDADHTSNELVVNQAGAGSSSASVDLDSTSDFTATTEFWIYLRNTQGGAITPASDGSTFLKITNLMVYSENEGATGIRLNSVCADLITEFSDIFNSDTSHLLATNARVVEPFISGNDEPEYLADLLARLAGFGDSNDGRYAVGLLDSERAATPNGKPVLFTADWPTTDDHDYFLSLDDPDIHSSVSITEDYNTVRNHLTLTYQDSQGWTQVLTPEDDASLKDTDSIAAYGQRDFPVRLGNATEANALEYGVRYLAEWKDPQLIVNGTITLIGSIDGAGGEKIPYTRIKSGKVLKINNYDNYVISKVRIDYDQRTASLSLGKPAEDPLFTASEFAMVYNDPTPTTDASGAGGTISRQPWWKILDEIGPAGRRKLKESGEWKEYKRKGLERFRKHRGR